MNRPERQALEDALKTERAGSATIRALSDYALLKEIECEMEREFLSHDELMDLQIRKTVIELAIQQWEFSKDARVYLEACDNAGAILRIYVEKYNNPWHFILSDLKDINLRKSKRTITPPISDNPTLSETRPARGAYWRGLARCGQAAQDALG